MNNPKVSVIIPVYNAAQYLKDCIDSVLAQSFQNIEIIVVNDGSTDDSFSIAQGFGNSIILLNQENKGASAARNNGLRHATGDYIQFLDADDILECHKIQRQVDFILSHNISDTVLTFGRWTILGKDVESMPDNQKAVWHNYNYPLDILFDFSNIGCCLPPMVYLTPMTLIQKAGLWDETLSLNDDGEFFARVIEASEKLCFCYDSLAMYRSTPASLSKRMSKKAASSQMKSLVKMSEIMSRANRLDKGESICNFVTASLRRLYPYYREERRIGEKYLSSRYPQFEISYPSLNLKERLFYFYTYVLNFRSMA